jgi:hypothetical protein
MDANLRKIFHNRTNGKFNLKIKKIKFADKKNCFTFAAYSMFILCDDKIDNSICSML